MNHTLNIRSQIFNLTSSEKVIDKTSFIRHYTAHLASDIRRILYMPKVLTLFMFKSSIMSGQGDYRILPGLSYGYSRGAL